jgi:thiamine-phosphate pyrophosphorylase
VRLCLVTDRHRLAAGETSLASVRRCLLAQARFAVEAEIDLIQLRERDLPDAELSAIAADLLALTRGTRTRVVINDRVDVALACGADGVHLRGDSISVAAARRLVRHPLVIGRSVHSAAEAPAAAGADYVVAGTVFATPSKAGGGLLGVDGLRAVVQAVAAPVLGIGGLTVERAGQVAEAGASGIAAIGLFIGTEREGSRPCRAIPLRGIADAVRRQFDTRKPAS